MTFFFLNVTPDLYIFLNKFLFSIGNPNCHPRLLKTLERVSNGKYKDEQLEDSKCCVNVRYWDSSNSML